MRHIPGIDRSQVLLLPEAVDDYVGRDNPVRFIDAFVDGLDLAAAGFERAAPKATGRPGYDPADLLKLYIYGYLNRVRSSRRLEAESKRNLEMIWLLRRLSPDFKTIADFRRINRAAFRQVFREFVRLCRELELFGRELVAVDGTRIKAVNSRKRNFTKAKLEKALAESDERLSRYLDRLDEAVHRRRPHAAAVGAGEQPRLPAQSDTAQCPFGGVVRKADAAVVEEAGEEVPAPEHVIHRLGHGGRRGQKKTLQRLFADRPAAPEEVRDQVRNLTRMQRLRTCAAWRPDTVGYRDPVVATKLSLKYLARRILDINDEIAELNRFIVPLVEELAPSLLELEGVGTENAGAVMVAVGDNPDRLRSEASFAMMCGACPIPASSGKTQRHRLNRGGNRQANSALHMVVVCRMRTDERTRAYVARRTLEGLSKREIMRCLKRYVAREIYRVLTAPSSA